jgi:hypothetical protein
MALARGGMPYFSKQDNLFSPRPRSLSKSLGKTYAASGILLKMKK